MLSWDCVDIPPEPRPSALILRPMNLDDLNAVCRIDQAAFTPLWQNSLDYLELAFRQAAVATVAEIENRMVGYQISTATPIGGHLARLAVLPNIQGQGIGYTLVQDLLNQFYRRGAQKVTVNTQKDNLASLALYRETEFRVHRRRIPRLPVPTARRGIAKINTPTKTNSVYATQRISSEILRQPGSIFSKLDVPSGAQAIVCLVHGLGEHSGRYAHLGYAMNEAGWAFSPLTCEDTVDPPANAVMRPPAWLF